jgi:spermidine synthase
MTEKIKSSEPFNRVIGLVLVCFFFSGMTGLIYEILWTRMIVKLIGGAPFAISIILTVFMGGLGVGSYIASRTIDRIRSTSDLVKVYGILELVIAAYGIVLPFLIMAFKPLYAVVYNQLFNYFMLYSFLTFLGCAVLLCIPVICMGATLPILCRFYVSSLSHLGTHTGRLYGLNTIGAAAGSLICGFWLIDMLGVWGTLIVAILINSIIGLLCVYTGYNMGKSGLAGETPKETFPEPAAEEKGLKEGPGVLTGALVIFAVSGFCSMAYEVIWAKLLGLIVGPTTYSFTIVLVTFILGLALGSMFFGWLSDRIGRTIWILLITQVVAALFALGISHLLGNSQLFFAKLIYHFQDQFALRSFLKALVLFIIMIVPTLCLGATFPLVGKIYTRSVSRVGRSIGFAYAINTVGAVLGSFCAGFILIPLVGKEKGLSIVVGLQLLTALLIAGYVLLKGKRGGVKLIPLAVPVAAGLVLCFYYPQWDRAQLSLGKYHRFDYVEAEMKNSGWLNALLNGPRILSEHDQGKLVFYGDGIGGFTTVTEYVTPFGTSQFAMANSGKPDASSHGDMKTQAVSAHFPMLFHKDPKKVMVLGLASGITAGEVLNYPVEKLDVIDISEQVVRGSDYFIPWNNDVLKDPRTNLIIQDGRAHLNLTREKYDVIISEPSNPWMAGLASLFTRDMFALAKERLNEDGIFVQFIHSYQMNWESFALVGRTFSDVFPESLLLLTFPSGNGVDYLLVGFKGSEGLKLANGERNLSYAQRSKIISLSDPRLLYRLIVTEDLKALFGEGPLNTDSNPRLEFAAPKLLYWDDPMVTKELKSKRRLSSGTGDIIENARKNIDMQIDFAAYALSVYSPFPGMVDLSQATESQRDRFFGLLDRYCSENATVPEELKDDTLLRRCRLAQISGMENNEGSFIDKVLSYSYMGYLYSTVDRLEDTITSFNKVLSIKPQDAGIHYNIGVAYGKLNRVDEAIEHFKAAIQIDPEKVYAYKSLGYFLARTNKLGEASGMYKRAIELAPDDPEILNEYATLQLRQGLPDEAIPNFRKVLQAKTDWVEPMNNLAWILAVHKDNGIRNPLEAISLAERACELTDNRRPDFLDTLAVAYAAAGRFSDAVDAGEKAVALARSSGNEKLAEDIQSRILLFKDGKPYIEGSSPK